MHYWDVLEFETVYLCLANLTKIAVLLAASITFLAPYCRPLLFWVCVSFGVDSNESSY